MNSFAATNAEKLDSPVAPYVAARTPLGQERYRERVIIGKIGTKALRAPKAAANTPDTSLDKYLSMARAFHLDFVGGAITFADSEVLGGASRTALQTHETRVRKEKARSFSTSYGIRHGFDVCGYVLGYGVDGYKKYIQEKPRDPSVEELCSVLLHPKTVERSLVKLANMEALQNRTWETWLGLRESDYNRRSLYDHLSMSLFEIVDTEDGAYLSPNQEYVLHITRDYLSCNPPAPKPEEKCPARFFLPQLWSAMVNKASSEPSLFAADLAMEPIQ